MGSPEGIGTHPFHQCIIFDNHGGQIAATGYREILVTPKTLQVDGFVILKQGIALNFDLADTNRKDVTIENRISLNQLYR